MKSFRKIIDLTPHDKTGSSFWGLKREEAKILGLIFIGISITLADPPFGVLPFDFINLLIAVYLVKIFGWGLLFSTVITYTIIPFGLFFIGLYIYPYHTHSLFNGYINKFKKWLKHVLKNPYLMIIGLIIFYFVFQWYKKMLGGSL